MYCGTGESEKRENCHRCYLSLDPSSKIVANTIFIIISIHLEPFRIIIPDPSLGLVWLLWLLKPSSNVLFWIFSIHLLKKIYPEPWNYSFTQFHAQKALLKVSKICNIHFWIENDPPPWNFSENSSDLAQPSFPKDQKSANIQQNIVNVIED